MGWENEIQFRRTGGISNKKLEMGVEFGPSIGLEIRFGQNLGFEMAYLFT